jgi:hypothetical protein
VPHLVLARHLNAGEDDPGTVLCYHRLSRYEAGLGAQTSLDGQCFSFLGDVIEDHAPPMVWLPDKLFNAAGPTQVPTFAQMDQLLAEDPTRTLVGPFQTGALDTESISVRRIAFVPNKYVPLVLTEAITPRVLWETLRGAILSGGDEQDCTKLLSWMRVALTRRAAGEASRVAVEPLREPQILGPSQGHQLLRYKLGIVRGDLPELRTSGNSADFATDSLQWVAHLLGRQTPRTVPVKFYLIEHVTEIRNRYGDGCVALFLSQKLTSNWSRRAR